MLKDSIRQPQGENGREERKQDVYLLSYTRKNSIWIKELNIFKNETRLDETGETFLYFCLILQSGKAKI